MENNTYAPTPPQSPHKVGDSGAAGQPTTVGQYQIESHQEDARSSAKSRKFPALIIVVAAVLLGVVVYEIILPSAYGKSYLRNVQGASQSLQSSLSKVADSTTRPIFTSSEIDNQSDKNDIVILKESVQDAEAKLASFDATTRHLRNLSLSGYLGSYRQAQSKQQQASSVFAEVKKRLGTYKELVTHLDNSNQAAAMATKEVSALNSIATMTDPAEVSKTLRDAAAALRRMLDAADYPIPKGFEESHQKSIALMSQLASQCDDLADAVDRNDKDQMGSIYTQMQVTGDKTRAAHQEFQALIGQDTDLIRSIKELPTLVSGLSHD